VILLRKLVLQCVVVLVSDLFVQGAVFITLPCFLTLLGAVSLGNWIVAASLFLQLLFRSYDRADMNRLDIVVLCVTYVNLLVSMPFVFPIFYLGIPGTLGVLLHLRPRAQRLLG
jgi:hypothetical protein